LRKSTGCAALSILIDFERHRESRSGNREAANVCKQKRLLLTGTGVFVLAPQGMLERQPDLEAAGSPADILS
jgi:hypothetical protein